MRPRRSRSAPIALATALISLLTLSSCAAEPTYDATTAAGLREHVVTVSTASAAGDWAGALAALDAMTAEVDEAQADGRIDGERLDSILLAMELVRQDLQMAIDEAEDAAERQRLEEEQAALQEQLDELVAERAEQERREQEEQQKQQEDAKKDDEKKDDEKKDDEKDDEKDDGDD
ncbi:hypothetical protein [Agromyces sp. ZXT2-6]|uniref:hypothetical protein n=1 Tax=Agromyces sp. ZXT2-6 TaxID=3461153 RepID=UPI0040551426